MKQAVSTLSLATVAMSEVMFSDDFEKGIDSWVSSTWKPDSEISAFELGTSEYSPNTGKMIKTTKDARFYGMSKAFDKPFSSKDKHLLVQYEVLQDKDVECGGGYLKMGPKPDDLTAFGDPTEYSLMFGPDKCGHTKRTHVIFNYKGKNVLKKADLPYKQADDGISTLYRLTVSPDNKVTVSVDDEEIYSGDMESDWELLAPKEIDDPEDKKPSDWVDEAMMDDPEDKKPEDWVEEKEIVDSSAKQPADWDAEEDGEWEAPMIPNPDYKGPWSAKRISNPDYKGVWAPKKIANPEYVADDKLHYMAEGKDLGFLGFDLWQVKAGTLFDNIVVAVGDSLEEVKKEADEKVKTFKEVVAAQKDAKSKTTTTTTTTEATSEEDEDDDGEGADKGDDDL